MSKKASDPARRLGIYKQFSDVPEEHRLESYQDRYENRDLWGEFIIEVFLPQHNSYQTQQEVRRTRRKMEYCDGRTATSPRSWTAR